MRFVSPLVAIRPGRRRLRFRLDDFLVRMWLLKALNRFTLPLAVSLKRFFAPLCVFIFGIEIPFGMAAYFGARIIVMFLPSSFASASILPMSARSADTRSSTSLPSSGCAT